MAADFELVSAQPPEIVLAAIGNQGGHWRDSPAPAELLRRGSFSVVARVTGQAFRLSLESLSDPPPTEFALVGEVLARDDGGSLVRARTTLHASPSSLDAIIGVALLALCIWFRAVWLGVAVAAAWGLSHWLQSRRLVALTRDSDPGIRHLMDRLQAAVGAA
jgi:hypothetical protein